MHGNKSSASVEFLDRFFKQQTVRVVAYRVITGHRRQIKSCLQMIAAAERSSGIREFT
jgi:hypothetical protein